MRPTDLLVHDGYTWHQSGPNVEEGHTRKGVSIRFVTTEATFDPGLDKALLLLSKYQWRQEIYYLIAPLFLWFLKTVDMLGERSHDL